MKTNTKRFEKNMPHCHRCTSEAYQQSVSIVRASQRIDERDSGASKSFSSSHASLSV